ncbi:bifunctional diguanylate cyclase/phosphodiesterase [Acanthopleuribacter pedis]|uniref:EAL domain-containing protein n=1 Tax=Acanthopleuribacter pedis TaxID=442870 RepID=A0A8J7QNM6_9BACT|nr:GGDEF domain-containing phosphodiesterase [Acanthopleuribacter pedis]MBO1321743.1 EAL domain-containing protein [Acanthopleuribacter pedis]
MAGNKMIALVQQHQQDWRQYMQANPGVLVMGSDLLVRSLDRLAMLIGSAAQPAVAKTITQKAECTEMVRQLKGSLVLVKKAAFRPGEHADGHLNQEKIMFLLNGLGNLLNEIEKHLSGAGPAVGESGISLGDQVATRQQLERDLAAREGQETSMVRFEFDGLEKINNREGREKGDEVLKQIAEIIQNITQGQAQIYKDGPGFSVVGDWQRENQVRDFSSKVRTHIEQTPKGNMLKVVIGVVLNETENVMDHAQQAAAGSEKGETVIFTPELEAATLAANNEHQLAIQILEQGEFYAAYQEIFSKAKVGLFSKPKRKFEALWRSPQMSPFKFFKSIKEEGRLREVTAKLWPKIFAEIAPTPYELALNITAEELEQHIDGKPFLEWFEQTAQTHKVRCSNIIIELVEWSDDDELTESGLDTLQGLISLGCCLALDDYGVRSSNLVRVMQLCEYGIIPDYFKVDAALVKGLNRYIQNKADGERFRHSVIGIRSIVDLVRELRKETKKEIGIVAEFVDNQLLQRSLENLGVTHFQGFFLAKPKPAAQAFS